MNIIETKINGLLILEPRVFGDDRGWFMESLTKNFEHALTERDLDVPQFVQDNHSFSQKAYCAVCIISLIRMRRKTGTCGTGPSVGCGSRYSRKLINIWGVGRA